MLVEFFIFLVLIKENEKIWKRLSGGFEVFDNEEILNSELDKLFFVLIKKVVGKCKGKDEIVYLVLGIMNVVLEKDLVKDFIKFF